MPVTIRDISKRTGLAMSTVSKYLNGGHLREENRLKIEAAIAESDFRVNEVARALKTRRSRTIGIVIPELNNSFYISIVSMIEDLLSDNGYDVIVADCRSDPRREQDATEFMIKKMVDGIINIPATSGKAHLETAMIRKKPIVLIDRRLEGMSCCAVLLDNIHIARDATNHLIANGHTKIGIVCGPTDFFASQEILLGYRQAFIQNGLIPDERCINHCDFTVESGYDCVKNLLKASGATALFTPNYEITLGAIIAINELGLHVPEDLSLIGYDSQHLSKIFQPNLTVVSQPTDRIAQAAVQLMLERLDNVELDGDHIIKVNGSLLFGRSVKRLT